MLPLKSQVVSLQTAHSCANARVLLGDAYIGSGVAFEGAIQVLRNAGGGGGCPIFREKKALRRCNIQCY